MIPRFRATCCAAMLAVTLSLAACANKSLGTGQDVTPSPDKALVIIGFSYLADPIKYRIGGDLCPVTPRILGHDALAIDIAALDEQPGIIESLGVPAIYASEGRCTQMTPTEPVGYNFLHLPPGRYAVRGLATIGRLTVNYQQLNYRLRFRNSPTFQVKAGDVVYLGDVVAYSNKLSTPGTTNLADQAEFRATTKAAAAELARRNGPIDKLRYIPLKIN